MSCDEPDGPNTARTRAARAQHFLSLHAITVIHIDEIVDEEMYK